MKLDKGRQILVRESNTNAESTRHWTTDKELKAFITIMIRAFDGQLKRKLQADPNQLRYKELIEKL